MVQVVVDGHHHHRSTTKTPHKPFKSKHATKGSLKAKAKGKLEDFEKGQRKTPKQMVMSKIERKNKAKQKQLLRAQQIANMNKVFDGRKGAARIVAIVPLCEDVSVPEAVDSLNTALDIEANVPECGLLTVGVDRFKQRLQYVLPQGRDFTAISDACKVADFVLIVLSAVEEVDKHGEFILRAIEGQGISNVATAVQHLSKIEQPKRQQDTKKSLLSFIKHFFPTEERVFSLDNPQESSNLIRSLCTQFPKGVHWRDARAYMLAEEVNYTQEDGLTISGTVRGKGFKADRLVHLPGYGDFQIDKICANPKEVERKQKAGADTMEVEQTGLEVLDTPTEDQETLEDLAPEELVIDDEDEPVEQEERKGVLLDDHHYFDDKDDEAYKAPRKLPKGTSSYQAAWFIDGEDYVDDDESEDEEMKDDQASVRPEDGAEGMDIDGRSVRDPTEYGDAQSEMFLDPSPDQEMEEIKAFRNRRNAMEEDLEFPDEIELHPNVNARERLSRYRGLKSLRSSKWETREDRPYEPAEWRRLAQIDNYKAVKNKVLDEALVGGVAAGTRVKIYIRDGPEEAAKNFTSSRPFPIYSLLRHEHKKAIVNVTILPDSEYNGEDPVKSKDEIIVQFGPRTLAINPLFSQTGVSPNKIYKFERFLQPGKATVATFIGPATFGNIPALFYRRNSQGELTLLGTGSLLNVSSPSNRVIVKRIVLTGHPYKIHKKVVTVRYMFFNAEDVAWFKALQLFTKRGRTGYIKESLGTHGYFKATFDGRINPQDAVAVSLYKRVFPRMSKDVRL